MIGKKLGIFAIIGITLLAFTGVAVADTPKTVTTHTFSESATLGGRTLAPSFDRMLVTPMSISKVKLGDNYWPIKIKVMSPTSFHIDMMTNARDGLKDTTTGFKFQNQATIIVNGVDVPINTGSSWKFKANYRIKLFRSLILISPIFLGNNFPTFRTSSQLHNLLA